MQIRQSELQPGIPGTLRGLPCQPQALLDLNAAPFSSLSAGAASQQATSAVSTRSCSLFPGSSKVDSQSQAGFTASVSPSHRQLFPASGAAASLSSSNLSFAPALPWARGALATPTGLVVVPASSWVAGPAAFFVTKSSAGTVHKDPSTLELKAPQTAPPLHTSQANKVRNNRASDNHSCELEDTNVSAEPWSSSCYEGGVHCSRDLKTSLWTLRFL